MKIKAKEEGKQTDEEITPKKSEEYTVCIHGTYWKAWEDMKQKGITRFYPNHIHFASGMLGKDGICEFTFQFAEKFHNCSVVNPERSNSAVCCQFEYYSSYVH